MQYTGVDAAITIYKLVLLLVSRAYSTSKNQVGEFMNNIMEEYAIEEILSIRETLEQIDDQIEVQCGVKQYTLVKYFLTLAVLEVRDIASSSKDKLCPWETPNNITFSFIEP